MEQELTNRAAQLFAACHIIVKIEIMQKITSSIWRNRKVFLQMTSDPIRYDLLNNINAQKTETKEEILARLLLGKDFIDSCYLHNPDIRSIAKECNMSEFHFYRCFKRVFGITPYQYVLGKRLEHARKLVNETQLRIGAIAQLCSFRDVFSFSKAFKRKYGLSPSKER